MHRSNRKSIRRRSVVVLLAVAALAVAAALASVAAAGSSSNGPPQTRVYGGGNVTPGSCTDGQNVFCTGGNREFSILAIRDPNEDVTYGSINGSNGTKVRVTCLAVSGNVAEVGGVIVQSPDPSVVGGPFLMFVRDSGSSDPRDGLSPAFQEAPPGKATCKDVSSDAFGYGFFSLTNGDIAVEKITNQNG